VAPPFRTFFSLKEKSKIFAEEGPLVDLFLREDQIARFFPLFSTNDAITPSSTAVARSPPQPYPKTASASFTAILRTNSSSLPLL